MSNKIDFSRKIISNLDINPYANICVDEIYDHGFFNSAEPRIGIIKHKNDNSNNLINIEKVIKNYINTNYKINVNVKLNY